MKVERSDEQLPVAPRTRVAGERVEHLGDVRADRWIAREQPEVGVDPRRLRVVVARPDVDVMAHAVALAPDHEDALDVRLQARDPVDHVDAGLLELLRPSDVRPLVEAGLELHHADRLLATLGGVDQRRHQRRVRARPVDGLLDREHVGIGDRLLDEPLDRCRERVIGVVEEDVALANRGEDVALLGPLADEQARWGDGGKGRVAELLVARDPDHVPEIGEVEQALLLVELMVLDPERGDQLIAQPLAHPALDLEPDDLAEPPPAQLLLDRLHQVVGLVGDVVVGVAGDPEQGVLEDLHPREERAEVVHRSDRRGAPGSCRCRPPAGIGREAPSAP